MSNLMRKKENLKNAVQRLEEAIDSYKDSPNDVMRDGVIQRYEFCWELSWKTMRAYLMDIGINEFLGSKDVFKEAYAYGIIDDEQIWLRSLKDRNLTTHVYDEKTADEIFSRICEDYLPVFKKLSAYLLEEETEEDN